MKSVLMLFLISYEDSISTSTNLPVLSPQLKNDYLSQEQALIHFEKIYYELYFVNILTCIPTTVKPRNA